MVSAEKTQDAQTTLAVAEDAGNASVEESTEELEKQEEGSQETEPEVDWEARAGTLQQQLNEQNATLEKERENFRSTEIATLKQSERDRKLEENTSALKIIAEALASGDTEEIPARIAAQTQQTQQAQTDEEFGTEQTRAFNEIADIAKSLDVDPNSIESSPAFSNVMLFWNRAFEKNGGGLRYFDKAVSEAYRVEKKLLSERAKASQGNSRARSRREVSSTDTGPASGGVMTEKALEAKSASGAPLTYEENQRLQKYWNS